MGSPKVSNKTVITMAENGKKSLSKRISSWLFRDKKKETPKNEPIPPKETPVVEVENPAVKVLERLEKKLIEHKIKKEVEEKRIQAEISLKKDEDDGRGQRIDSQSSDDSGFGETKPEDDVAAALGDLKIEDGEKKKVFKTVVVARGPIKNNSFKQNIHPYTSPDSDDVSLRQIRQINITIVTQTLTGAQVIENSDPTHDDLSIVDPALKRPGCFTEFPNIFSQNEQKFDDALAVIQADMLNIEEPVQEKRSLNVSEHFIDQNSSQLTKSTSFNYDVSSTLGLDCIDDDWLSNPSIFPTPPRSENVLSPPSESHSYVSNTLSPERSSPLYPVDYERYQDLTPFGEFPLSNPSEEKKDRMTLKNFKDLQRELTATYNKKECCEMNRKSWRNVLKDHLDKLPLQTRRDICFCISSYTLDECFKEVNAIIIELKGEPDQVDYLYSKFALILHMVLTKMPKALAYDHGLRLLKRAVFCWKRPVLTGYLVDCIRLALRDDPSIAFSKECVFNEVDRLGDNILTACVREGDNFAQVLSELIRNDYPEQPPLFRINQPNAEGYTALHVCCSQHSATTPKLHIAHILLEHGKADIWKGDLKGGDTALHLAVNSATCDLNLVMMLFKQLDRKQWKSYAHCRNMSAVTPLEYARSATKSSTRQNYPEEVLDFLKKCR